MATISEALTLAIQHHQGGRLQAAEQIYRQILAAQPNHADALHLLGLIAHQVGQHESAVETIRRAIALNKKSAAFHNNLGEAYSALHRITEAAACYRQALKLKPNFAEAHSNLGNALKEQGKLDEAITCYRKSLALKPDFAECHSKLGTALQAQRKLDEAEACYRKSLQWKPDYAEAHSNLGTALQAQGKLLEAVACYGRALELKPDFAEACFNRGKALQDLEKLDEAVACYRRALELQPDFVAALFPLVHNLQHICHWQGLNALSQRLIDIVNGAVDGNRAFTAEPFSFFALPIVTTAAQQLRCAQLAVSSLPKVSGPMRRLVRKAKITIGYLSADFRAHATAWLVAELFEKHDRDRFAVFGYSYGPNDHGSMRARLESAFDRFVDLKDTTFAQAAERIAADEVDILVDLKGYTKDARTDILALRPAPIQVNYLGYPATMGAPFIDYILVDDFIVPASQQPFFTERLVHLPGCYQVNDSQREIAAHSPSRAECGLPEQGFVFCSFNNTYKITAEMFDVWMRLLQAVPGSVMWLLAGNRFAPANLCREAQARGIAAQRLVFADRLPLPEHLARHRLADLFLDAFPVNAHTTASDALWAGCPLLTLAGETFVSRVAGSLLRALGLPELITTSLEEYQAMALRLARNADVLAGLRARLQLNRQTSPLFDARQFARNVEKAYVAMSEICVAGEKPRAFAVKPTVQETPDDAAACYNRALKATEQGNPNEAIDCYRRALELKPDYAEAHSNLGNVLQDQGRLDDAVACFRRTLELKPDFFITHYNLGNVLQNQGQHDEAIACYRRALKFKPDYAEAHSNLGISLEKQGKVAEAIASYRRALELKPNFAEAHASLGAAFQIQGRLDEAAACYRRAIELKPGRAVARVNLSLLMLLTGDLERGWTEYEWRWQTNPSQRRDFEQALWDGQPLHGKTILLHAEQGLGDTIQFVRYAPLIKQHGGTVVLECQPPLRRLLESCSGVDRLMVRGEPLPAFDVHLPLLSLPRVFGTNLENVPAAVPYVQADPLLVEHWRKKLEPLRGFKIGINWRGRPGNPSERNRGFPLHELAPLTRLPGVCLISLQKGPGWEEIATTAGQVPVVDLGRDVDETAGPFMDTAAIMRNLDLVISSDTVIPHLAGALGVPVWMVLPFVPDWRWLLDRADSPWYPTMRLFRQSRAGQWQDVFLRIADALNDLRTQLHS